MYPESYWNYRIVKRTEYHEKLNKEYISYSIHSVHYEYGIPKMISVDSMPPYGETVEELREDLNLMMKAFEKDFLNYDDFKDK